MKDLYKGYIDLIFYQVFIGALSIKYNQRICEDSDPDALGFGCPGLPISDEDEVNENLSTIISI